MFRASCIVERWHCHVCSVQRATCSGSGSVQRAA
jgi:hypothetical protein